VARDGRRFLWQEDQDIHKEMETLRLKNKTGISLSSSSSEGSGTLKRKLNPKICGGGRGQGGSRRRLIPLPIWGGD